MSAIETCLKSLPTPVQELIKGKEPREWTEAVLATGKPKKLVKLYESAANFMIREAAESAKSSLSSMKLKDKLQRRVDATTLLYHKKIEEMTKAPKAAGQLSTIKVTSKEGCKRLHTIAGEWAKYTLSKGHVANRLDLHEATFKNWLLADDSAFIADCLKSIKKKRPEKNEFIYATFSEDGTVQAMATCDYSKKDGFWLGYMGTNPENIKVFDGDQRKVSGAATAILSHFVYDILQSSKRTKKLSFISLTSAKPFYDKLGIPRHDTKYTDYRMKEKELKTFLAQHPQTMPVASKEPKFKS